MKKYLLNSINTRNPHFTPILQVRGFTKSSKILAPNQSVPPYSPVRPFSESTDEIRSFLEDKMSRDVSAIIQLDHTIEHSTLIEFVKSIMKVGHL